LKKVLFVCIGNTCRSPMAEAFANSLGSDVLVARSAGLAPVLRVIPETVSIMRERHVDMSGHVPMPFDPFEADAYDVVVNMSGFRLPGKPPKGLLEWAVNDPYGQKPAVYRKVRDEIEERVKGLIVRLRKNAQV
jgi:arsenate reductase